MIAIVKHHAELEIRAGRIGELAQSLEIRSIDRSGGLDLDTHQGSRLIFDNDVDLVLILVAEVIQTAGPTVLINGSLDGAQQIGCPLHLVDDGAIEIAHESGRVVARTVQHRVVVERDVDAVLG